MKKAQLIPIAFIVLLISSAIVGWTIYNIYYGGKYQARVFTRLKLDTLRNEIERIKGYSKQALIYSAHQALREHACLGGQIGASEWICNGPNTYSPSDSKECLEKYTKYYVNVYLGNYTILDLPIVLAKKNFSDCVYEVDPNEVLNLPSTYDPFYDEGNFWVNVTGAIASVSEGEASMSSNVNLSTYITRNRFWYLFRIFYEWANDDVYTPCVCEKIGCGCGSTSGEEGCTSCKKASEECGERALKDLQRRFNKIEVKCNRTDPYRCCAQGIGPLSCIPQYTCLPWPNSICISDCKHECREPPPPGKLCPVSLASPKFYSGSYSSDLGSTLALANLPTCSDCRCDVWYEARFASGHQFTCIDNKYHVPSEKGPVPLIFRVNAIAFLRAPDLCHSTVPCSGTYEKSCSDCNCPPCPENPCY